VRCVHKTIYPQILPRFYAISKGTPCDSSLASVRSMHKDFKIEPYGYVENSTFFDGYSLTWLL